MISPNSFCGFIFTRALDMKLNPPFLYNLLNKNEETNLHKVLKSYLLAHSVDLSSQRPKDMILDPPILQNPLNQNEEPNLI